jgi:UDP-N-acetylglucosamine--N-acetylmuramyl-(pentapeptide) pyrophosphoryl-undecaprenol N-acetylglucosamine transferase
MRIVFTGGGTAGHIMPCIALMEELKDRHEIHFIGSKTGMEKEIIARFPYVKYHAVTTVKFIRKPTVKNLAIPFSLLKGRKEAGKILKEINPDVVFSKGGFVALPAALAARCPLIIHECDRTIGLCNRLTAKKAAVFCVTFDETAEKVKNAVVTGMPIRRSLFLPKKKGFRPCLLVMGGSLGAAKINKLIVESEKELTQIFNIIHITGRGKATGIDNPHYKEFEFVDDIASMYSRADIAFSRGGAGALFELAALKIPALIVPLPKGVSRGDQICNAAYFQQKGLAKVIEEENLSAEVLVKLLQELLVEREIREALEKEKNINGLSKIVEIIESVAKKDR